MATRAATFTAKIRTLYDYHLRTVHNILPLPSGIDVANTLKYFSQTLLSVLRDVPTILMEVMQSREHDHTRMTMFPNLDYKGLYYAVIQLVDMVPLIQYGATALGQAILLCLTCLIPFLEHEYMDTLPYIVATCMAMFPPTLHKDIIEMLCNHLLPFTIAQTTDPENQNYAMSSTAAICMFVFQYSDNLAHHCQLLECLMSLKADILRDLLCVIAHGTSSARAPAANLLFYYWPALNPALQDRRVIQMKFTGWEPLICQRENCLSPVNNEAVKLCLDHSVVISSGDHPPPLYICQDCADQIRRELPSCHIKDVLLPIQQISLTCENKNCRSNDKTAVSTCFSIECSNYNGNRPIRYCSQCHSIRHNTRRGVDHIFHLNVISPWEMDPETQGYLVEAIVSLLKEAQPLADKRIKDLEDRHPRVALLDSELNQADAGALEERRLLSRYGIYLLVGLCTPNEDTPVETLGRLLGMLFQWFDSLAYLPDDQAGNTLERLKSEYIHGWLLSVSQSHFEVFVSCLLPHPVEYARVGGHWDTLVSRTSHIKDGFNRLFCLVPYEIINLEVWDYIMPNWMEAIRNEVPEEELQELQMLLSKVLDPEMSPLGFDAHQMYRFISIRFQNTSAAVQEQALCWLQILSFLNVVIPLSLLFTMFNDGVKSCTSPTFDTPPEGVKILHSSKDDFMTGSIIGTTAGGEDSRTNSPLSSDDQPISHVLDFKSEEELNLPCFVLMLDILLKQLELQEVDPHQGIEHIVSRESLALIEDMICAPWVGTHACKDNTTHDCTLCEFATTFYQLSLEIIEYISPVMEIRKSATHPDSEVVGSDDSSRRGSPTEEQPQMPLSQIVDVPASPQGLEDGKELGIAQVFTATVQTVLDAELDTVAIMPTEEVVKAVARAVTLTETDVGLAKVSVALPTVVDENDQAISKDATEDDGNFWHTSQGKFKFTLEELPPQLQLIYALLKELGKFENADILYHILCCLKLLCLHAECLSRAAKEHRGFLIWCQENLLISSLWKLLQAEFSHISEVCVQVLSHCITLPSGADVFWKIIEDGFHNTEWTTRSSAVEKVTMIARFVEWEPVKQSQPLQSALANAFCYLISSMDDSNPTVAQKAMLCLETIKDSSLKCLCWCLEAQFDTVIMDRPMVLQTIFQLYTRLSDRNILSWEFFLNRFDALFLEAQVYLERSGDIAYPRDLKNSDMNSEMFLRKLNRAHEALTLSQSDSIRSLSVSLGSKLRYKRTMSAPGGMIARQEKIVDKEKLFGRQSSAPVLKRKYSKFGIAQVVGQLPNHLFPDGNLKEPQQEENNFLTMLHRVMEMEDSDKDTMHLLVFLFMQFLSRSDHAYPSDEKAVAKIQHFVLHHLDVLLGYNPNDKVFCIPPHRLRNSPVVNAFLFSLPTVLDLNFKMGSLLLATCLPLLQYCPSPQRCTSEIQQPSYSLWYLEPYARHSWLMSTLTFIYKYRYSTLPYSQQVQGLVRIILNTLQAQDHQCQQFPDGCLLTTPNTSRSRDLSTVSTGDLPQGQERESPPHSPGITGDTSRVIINFSTEAKVIYHISDTFEDSESTKYDVYNQESQKNTEKPDWIQPRKPRKPLPDFNFSSDADDIEPELEAIPESPKSDITQHESPLVESFVQLQPFKEAPLEKAQVHVETGVVSEDSIVIVTPPLNSSLKVLTATVDQVDSQMSHEISAFHKSFEKDSQGSEPHGKKSLTEAPATVSAAETDKKFASLIKTQNEDHSKLSVECSPASKLSSKSKLPEGRPPFRSSVSSCYRQKSFSGSFDSHKYETPTGPNSLSHSPNTLCPPEVNVDKYSHLKPPEGKEKPKLQRSVTLDCGIGMSKTESNGKKLEILDARQLEQSVRRREPTVISQCDQQASPYLFQPIHTHPITSHVAESLGKIKSDYKTEPIKVEPRRSPANEIKEQPANVAGNNATASMPWTIEVHSPIKIDPLLPVPKPERLLAIGQPLKPTEGKEDVRLEKVLMVEENIIFSDKTSGEKLPRTAVKPLQSTNMKKKQITTPFRPQGMAIVEESQCETNLPVSTKPATTTTSEVTTPPAMSIKFQPLVGQKIIAGPHPSMIHIEPTEEEVEEDPFPFHELPKKPDRKKELRPGSLFKYNVEKPYEVEILPSPVKPVKEFEPSSLIRSPPPAGTGGDIDEDTKQMEKTDGKLTEKHEERTVLPQLSSLANRRRILQMDGRSFSFDHTGLENHNLIEKKRSSCPEKSSVSIAGAPKQYEQYEKQPLVQKLSVEKSFAEFQSLQQSPHAFHRIEQPTNYNRQLSGFKTPTSKGDPSPSVMQEAAPMPIWPTEAKLIEPKLVQLEEHQPKTSVIKIHQAQIVTNESVDFSQLGEDQLRRSGSLPKRLIKQSHITDVDLQHQSSGSTEAASIEEPDEEQGLPSSHHHPQDHEDQKGRHHFRQRRHQRMVGITSADVQKLIDQRNSLNRKSRKDTTSQGTTQRNNLQQSSLRCGEEAVVERCSECGAVLEQYSDDELALCIVILATFIHREPALAAPTLPEILRTVAKIASSTMYAWQQENNIYLPGGASSVAKQFIRCVLHQLAPNGIFLQLFQTIIDDADFFKTIASALTDFNELNPIAPLQLLLEGLNDCKVLPVNNIQQIMYNIAVYMECLPLETASSSWNNIIPQFDTFFRKLHLILPGQILDMQPCFKIMISILKIPGINSFKSILDPFSKMLSYTIQNFSLIYQYLLELCHLCNRAFTKERDKLLLSRTVVFELVQALKFKSNICDDNLLMLVQFVVQDAGGTLGPSIIIEDLVPPIVDVQNLINTSACECMRQNLNDALDFVADVHTLSKVKSNFKGTMVGLNEDTLGAALKAGIAQYLALEITRGNSRDNRAISRYLPWLCNPPTAVQQGPKEFLDCVAHIRLLSWLLLGALTHTAMLGTNSSLVCQPIPLEASCHVADHIQVILTGFAEQSKASVIHMSSLFHAFILCQLWTMYCEQMASLNPPGSEHHNSASITLTDFWAKITPSILQLLSHSKVLAEMVNLHFLSLMEALLECNSTVLAKLFPLWSPVLYAYQGQLPGHLQVRLQTCEDRCPPTQTKDEVSSTTHILLKWLQRLQFKMGQIELQSSAATQFYSV